MLNCSARDFSGDRKVLELCWEQDVAWPVLLQQRC